VTSIEHVYHVD